MFARIKKSGKYGYLQIVENRKIKGKVVQRVLCTIGRMDQLKEKDRIETLIQSLSRFSEKVLLILSGKSDVSASAKKIGPALIFERLWKELGIKKVVMKLLSERKFGFDVERALFLTVLHRLFASGSDRSCDKWRENYVIEGTEGLSLHHLYRAMNYLGEEDEDQRNATPFSPRCTKDRIEEGIFRERRDLFTGLDLVFFDTTSIYFEGEGGEKLGRKGHSKDHRPDLNQMVVGVILDNNGKPVCCEMWPGNTTDVKTLIPVIDRIRSRFSIGRFCVVADRGMISEKTVKELDKMDMPYILGARMRKASEVRQEVLSHPGRYREVHPEGKSSKDPAPLKVKEVLIGEKRYIVCLNTRQARKDAQDRKNIIESLKEKVRVSPKNLIGNKGYRKYLTVDRNSVSIDQEKVEYESRFDGKWVLVTNTDFSADHVAMKYKELWQVEHVFRDVKSVLETRPVYHQKDENFRGHVFCSFLALVLRKELERRLEEAGYRLEWADMKQDLKSLQEVIIEDNGKTLALRTECVGTCSKLFQAVGVAIPPTIRTV
ncbi:MAG: IS1634 family transposase [Candidatus Brocadiaceae bacterium]|nr:IS1634 family transposase [Candidatus Brocadiaceae bacterium]